MSSSPPRARTGQPSAFLIDAYREEEVRGEKRTVLALQNRLAPIKIAVLPLLEKTLRHRGAG